MRAAVITQSGGPEVLAIQDMPEPILAPDHVLVKVRASALNRADLLQRQGKYPAPAGSPKDISGIEFSGSVAAVGAGVRLWHEGQRVFGLIGGAAHAEFVSVHERTLMEIPGKLSWTDAAAIPEAFITAHDALCKQAALRPSELVLIHAVGSGVGLAAVQLTRALGAVPFGTSRTRDKLAGARQLGLEEGLELRNSLEPLAEFARRVTSGNGFHVVLDLVGGAYAGASVLALGMKGRLLLVGTVGGRSAELDLGQVLGKRLQLIGTVLRARPLEERIAVVRSFAAEVLPFFAGGKLRPTIDSEFRLDQIQDAHRRLESNETFGKVVLRVDG